MPANNETITARDWDEKIVTIGENPRPKLTKDKAKIKYISRGQSSPYELAFGIKLGRNSHSKSYTEIKRSILFVG